MAKQFGFISQRGMRRLVFAATVAVVVLGGSACTTVPSANVMTSPTPPPGLAFGPQHRTWVIGHALPPNVMLHWHENSYIAPTTSPSHPSAVTLADNPDVGHIIRRDNWVITDGTGAMTLQHSVSIFPDGSFDQETFDNAQESVTVRGPAYKGDLGGGDHTFWCVTKSSRMPSVAPYTFPPYLDTANVMLDGFHKGSHAMPFQPVPDVAATGIVGTPLLSYTIPTEFTTWQATGSAQEPSFREKILVDTDTDGRIITFTVNNYNPMTDPNDQYGAYQWYSIGTVDVYPASATFPAWVLTEPVQVTKGC